MHTLIFCLLGILLKKLLKYFINKWRSQQKPEKTCWRKRKPKQRETLEFPGVGSCSAPQHSCARSWPVNSPSHWWGPKGQAVVWPWSGQWCPGSCTSNTHLEGCPQEHILAEAYVLLPIKEAKNKAKTSYLYCALGKKNKLKQGKNKLNQGFLEAQRRVVS